MKTAKMKSSSNPRTRNPRITKGIVVMMVAVFIISSTSLFSPVTCRNDVFAQGASAPKKVLRIGYFPNVNHAQAVIGFGTDEFKKQLGDNVDVQTFTFNAGPSAIEALLAKRIDATYVGSNPAINGYIVSGGKDLRIISGGSKWRSRTCGPERLWY